MVAGIMTEGSEDLVGKAWADAQPKIRSYIGDVTERVIDLSGKYEVNSYGFIPNPDQPNTPYNLDYVTVGDLHNGKPNILITGGVHGYEEGGVLGVLEFLEKHVEKYKDHFNFVVIPCVSPWAYEHDRRLTADRANPNRNFKYDTDVLESKLVMALVDKLDVPYLMTFDCHETTWTDPVILRQEGNTDIDPDDIHAISYLLETAPPESRLGDKMVAALEAENIVPEFCKDPELFGEPCEGGIIHDLNEKVPTLCMSFMLASTDIRTAPTQQAFTLEPFVTKDLFYDPKGLEKRARAQVVQICAALDAAIGRPAPQPNHLAYRR